MAERRASKSGPTVSARRTTTEGASWRFNARASASVGDVQQISVGNNNLGGTFTVNVPGVSGAASVVVPYNAPANASEGTIGRQSAVQTLTLMLGLEDTEGLT